MLLRARFLFGAGALWLLACGTDAAPDASTGASAQKANNAAGASGNAISEAGSGGRAGRRSPLSCAAHEDMQVTCSGELCPSTSKHERDPCFLPCCVTFEGAERCGFRGTSTAFTTGCVLPAMSDPSCDEVPQFEGCCEPTRHVCGVIGGFAPGCQTESDFATLPEHPKACDASVSGAHGAP